MRFPPPGSPPDQIAAFVDQVVQEAANDERRLQWADEAQRDLDLYAGDHWQTPDPGDRVRLVINRTVNCVISQYAIQAGDPVAWKFKPRETGEPAQVYLNTKLPEALLAAQLVAGANPGWTPDQPLPQPAVDALRQQIAEGEMQRAQAAAVGMAPPPGLPADVLVEVTDAAAAEVAQTVFEALADAADLQYVYGENCLLKNVLGVQATLCEWDDDLVQPVCTNSHMCHVFLDPAYSDQRRGQYAILDEPIDADEAVARYPHLAAEIRAAAQTGSLTFPGTRSVYSVSARFQRQLNREYVVMRHGWFRSQPYPMTPDEALAAGKVEEAAPPVAAPADPMDPAAAVAPPAYVLAASGEPTAPDAANWPVRYGVRQVRVVANLCVDDRECEAGDIPLPVNCNIPIPYSPYGQGEPVRLEGLQMALNRTITSIVTHHAYNAFPPEVAHEQIVDRLDESLRKARSKPGQRLKVPTDLAELVGGDLSKLLQTIPAGDMPADIWKLLEFLVQLIDKEGNLADVLQGNAAAGWSGEAIDSLQNAASQVIRAKSMQTEFYLRRMARIIYHFMRTRMTMEQWRARCGKYPDAVFQALFDRHKAIDVDITVSIASGSGASKARETGARAAAKQAGAPISEQQILRDLGLDPEVQLQEAAEWQRKLAALAPQPAAAVSAPSGPQGAPVVGAPAPAA